MWPVILATWEADTVVQGQPTQEVHNTPSQPVAG
jgi:hypothetical protein